MDLLIVTVWTTSKTGIRLDQSELKDKYPLVLAVFIVAVLFRWSGQMPPYDDAYHLKRIASFPALIEFDRDRGENGAWCPWPPLYDVVMSAFPSVEFVPVFGSALFTAAIAWLIARRAGLLAGAISGGVLAISPYLIGISHRGAIDHHWVEPMLVVAIVFAVERRRPVLLAIALTAAMFVQTALLIAAAIAFAIAFFSRASELAVSFAVPAVAIAAYRITRPPGYPSTIWFLGWPHAAMFAAAAIALFCASARRTAGAALGAAIVAPFLPTLLSGTSFFSGDPWLRSILEFQPMFRDASRVGTDIANLTGGAVLAFTLWRRERTIAIFSIAYFVLALSSRRFLVPGIALFAIAGALAATCHPERSEGPGRGGWRDFSLRPSPGSLATLGMTAVVLLPPLCYDAYAMTHQEPQDMRVASIARAVASKPPGRVLAPWWTGHAIDVIGKHPVVIDNFGSMPSDSVFANANDALLQRHPEMLRDYMKRRGITYLVLTKAATGLPATAAATGVDPKMYAGTKLARSTVWWKLTHGEAVPGFYNVP
jgi:hypothetical protein